MPATTATHTCTVVVTGAGGRCGKPAVTTFTSPRTGAVLAECADHAMPGTTHAATPAAAAAAAPHPPTRTAAPYVLVAGGKIVGYAYGTGPRVTARAAKLGARVVAVVR